MKSWLVFSGVVAIALVSAQPAPPGHRIKVMTQNLYLGTDLAPVIAAGSPQQLFAAVASCYNQAQRTNFPARAELIADEIAREQPDLIGLQECVTWYRDPYDPAHQATQVACDYLATLMDALAARHQPYAVIAIENGYDVEAPGLFGAYPTGLRDVRLADHEVLLARTDRGMTFRDAAGVNFANCLTVNTLAGPQVLYRGYCKVDVTFRGKQFRFITTHLEPDHPYFNVAQGQEILSGPANTSMNVIYLGDLNSPADGAPPFLAYPQAIAAGFEDAWLDVNPNDPGYTLGHNGEVNDPPSFTRRIDYVLFKGAKVVPVEGSIFGLDANLTTPGGLYPSDHGGLVFTIAVK